MVLERREKENLKIPYPLNEWKRKMDIRICQRKRKSTD
jgi:hypothetical protein